ncbi:MAG: hypothetical protein IKA82_01530 [Clostridia bacterium]|nr:hypothetical protein [Clostridia bacterium]
MKNKKALSIALYVIAALLVIFIIDLFIMFGTVAQTGLQKALIVICIVLIVFIAAMLVYGATLLKEREPNYFLFDRTLNKNIPVQNLTFKIVNDKMNRYIAEIKETDTTLWRDNVLDTPEKLGTPAEFRILLAYKMLYDLADIDDEQHWLVFYTWGKNAVQSVAEAVKLNGDAEMASTLLYLRDSFNGDISNIRDFLVNNKPYIQQKMLVFTKQNIELFY